MAKQTYANDALERRAAMLAIAFAVLAALGGILGQNAANEAFEFQGKANLEKVEMADQWAFYQARSTKLRVYHSYADLLQRLKLGPPLPEFQAEMQEYEREQKEIGTRAATLAQSADANARRAEFKLRQNDRYDLAVALLQIAIALVSLTVLVKKTWLLAVGVLFGGTGIFVFILPLLMKPAG